jgi:hypothetical protein
VVSDAGAHLVIEHCLDLVVKLGVSLLEVHQSTDGLNVLTGEQAAVVHIDRPGT